MISPSTLHRIWPWLLATCVALLCLLIIAALAFGAVAIPFEQLSLWVQGQGHGQTSLIIQSLRLPRALLAAIIGALLAVCGAASQGLFRNPLADPSLIGVSAGAAAGASCVIVLIDFSQWHWLGMSLVSVGAFVGAILVVMLVYAIASSTIGTSVATMLLAGVAFSYLAGSLSNFLEFIADNQRLRHLSLWRMGGLDGADIRQVYLALGTLLVVYLGLFLQRQALNTLLLGESQARHLGINVTRVKQLIIICIAAGVGISVAIAGVISFVGLIVPHMVRMAIGPNHRFLLPISALVGAMLLVVADIFARTLLAPTELPIGLLTSLLGAPVFIILLRSRYRYGDAE